MSNLYLSIGTNLGDRRSNLKTAITLIGQRIGAVQAVSEVIETGPWGFQSPNAFLNQALQVTTDLNPVDALKAAQAIEREMGRTGKSHGSIYSDRLIDIDLIFYDNQVIELPGLKIPHPLMHKRLFVLEPLSEIAPELEHPVLHKTVREMLEEIRQQSYG